MILPGIVIIFVSGTGGGIGGCSLIINGGGVSGTGGSLRIMIGGASGGRIFCC
jgi:hypothetical protein